MFTFPVDESLVSWSCCTLNENRQNKTTMNSNKRHGFRGHIWHRQTTTNRQTFKRNETRIFNNEKINEIVFLTWSSCEIRFPSEFSANSTIQCRKLTWKSDLSQRTYFFLSFFVFFFDHRDVFLWRNINCSRDFLYLRADSRSSRFKAERETECKSSIELKENVFDRFSYILFLFLSLLNFDCLLVFDEMPHWLTRMCSRSMLD